MSVSAVSMHQKHKDKIYLSAVCAQHSVQRTAGIRPTKMGFAAPSSILLSERVHARSAAANANRWARCLGATLMR